MLPIRLLLLIPTLDQSGAEKQLTLLAAGLVTRGVEVRVVTLTRNGPLAAPLDAAGIPVTCLNKRGKLDFRALRQLRHEIKAFQPDILHTWLFAANSYGRLAVWGSRRPSVVVSERCVDSWKAPWQRFLDRRLAGRTAALVGNSASVVEFYRHDGLPPDRLFCVPNAVEPIPRPSAEERSALRRELGWGDDLFVAGFVGRLAAQKRVEDLIWAVETLRQIRPQLRLLIVGDGPERDRLQRMARDIHCQEHVRFLGHRADATRWYGAMDAFWLASDFEGQSNSLMEAMAAGLPVVVSNIPPNRELVAQQETGLLFQSRDTLGIKQWTRELIDRPDFARGLGEAAAARITREFNVDAMVSRYLDVYRGVLEPQDASESRRAAAASVTRPDVEKAV